MIFLFTNYYIFGENVMNKFTKTIIIIISLGIIFTISPHFNNHLNLYGMKNQLKSLENNDKINFDNGILEISNYWELSSPIEINDLGINNWTWAEGQVWFGDGNGTIANPYIIENVTIDVDNNFEYCIRIQNSSKYFIIQNCTVMKASLTGISLMNVNNSKLNLNNAINNDYVGIGLLDSNNNLISKNTAYDNSVGGIGLGNSTFNSILDNTVYSNIQYGIGLGDSSYNTISINIATQGVLA